ncbi:MAG: hypothetical protein ACW98X_13150 [Promethearchaeota archaeon]|jgi:hypothetical protein
MTIMYNSDYIFKFRASFEGKFAQKTGSRSFLILRISISFWSWDKRENNQEGL